MLEATGPNAQQIEYWNEVSGSRWVELSDSIEGMIEPFGAALLRAADARAGERVLDVGCGCGATSRALAARVGTSGHVTGIDISGPMLAEARRRRDAAGIDAGALEFVHADAQSHELPERAFDLALSRFGVMFFAQPEAAFANLRRALRDGGRLAFVCWQEFARNPWMAVPAQAAAQHVELPAPGPPDAPGPFAFADPARVRGILAAAGFDRIGVDPVELELDLTASRSEDEVVDFSMRMGPAAAMLAGAAPEVIERVAKSIRDVLAGFRTDDGRIVMPARGWLATARRGA